MPTDRLNVIFLTIDSLRFDRTNLGGYPRPSTPTLERLARDAIVCDNAFSLGPFTQSACIQLLTSSRPLSYGGFDNGAWGRPKTVFQRFHEAGYRTIALSTLHWVNRFMGYGAGLDEEWQLFILNTVAGVCVVNMRNSLTFFQEDKITAAEMLRVVQPLLTKFFRDASQYSDLRLADSGEYRVAFPGSLLVNAGYDYRKVKRVIARHAESFERDPVAYVRRHFQTIPRSHEWIAADWYYSRTPAKLLGQAMFGLGNRLVGMVDPILAENRQHRFKAYVDAYELADKVIAILKAHDGSKPFFIWAHFMDNHLPYVSGRGRRWYRETPEILARLGHPRDVNPTETFRDTRPDTPERWAAFSALYDAAVSTVDSQIGRVVDALEQLGFQDDTLVAVASDHGEEFGEHGNYAHLFTFYDHNTHVPLLFHRSGLGQQTVSTLTTLLDVAPTLANLAGIDLDPGWDGTAISGTGPVGRDHVIMETFFGGTCLFDRRPLYFGIRTQTHKYMWKEYRDPRDTFSPEGPELFDLESDSMEQNNIYRPDHPLVPKFNGLIANRMAELPEIPRQRIVAAFGDQALAELPGDERPALFPGS